MLPTGGALEAAVGFAMLRNLGPAKVEVFDKPALCKNCKVACGEGRRIVLSHTIDNTPKDVEHYCVVCSYALKEHLESSNGLLPVLDHILPAVADVENDELPFALHMTGVAT